MTDMIEILRNERQRIAQMLPTLDPTTEGYCRAVSNLGEVTWRLNSLETPPAPAVVAVPAPEPEPVETPPAPAPEPEPVEVDDVDWAKYRVALRERMAEARLGGLNTTELIASMGVSKFSLIPDEELPKLADLLDSALKEKG